MDRFFKKGPSEAAQAREEVELLQQKVKTMGEVATALEAQLNEEKAKHALLLTKTSTWKEKVRALTESDRAHIAQLELELGAYRAATAANGGELTPEMRAAVEAALQGLMAKHAGDVAACEQQVAAANATTAARDTAIAELQHELEAVKAVYLESQQRYAQEMESVMDHHEQETEALRRQLAALEEMDAMKTRLQEQRSEIESLENHSLQQAHIMSVLQEDLASATEQNEALQQQAHTLRDSLAALENKQTVWKEKVMQMKAKDNETIKLLQAELAQSRETSLESTHHLPSPLASSAASAQVEPSVPVAASSPLASISQETAPAQQQVHQLQIQLEEERTTHRQFEEKLEAWKLKAKQIKMQDLQTIHDLEAQCEQLRRALHPAHSTADHSPTFSEAPHRLSTSAESHTTPQPALPTVAPSASPSDPTTIGITDVQQRLDDKTAELQHLQDNMHTWKEKVKVIKAQDMQRLADQEAELQHLRQQLAATGDEQAQAADALRAELAAAQQERDDAAQLAQQHAADLEHLRQQLAATGDEQAQAADALRAELAAAQQERDDAAQLAQQQSEAAQRATEELEVKTADLAKLEESMVAWKEKVKAAKAQDMQRLADQEAELQQLRQQLAATGDEQAQAADALRAELAAAQQERDDAAQLAQQHAADLEHLRQQLAATGDEQTQAADALRAELAAAQQERDDAAQLAQQHAADLEHLRQQLAATGDEQAQAADALRAELAAAQQERDDAAQLAQQQSEAAQRATEELEVKTADLARLEESVVAWKEKVKTVKAADTQRIAALTTEVKGRQEAATGVWRCVRRLVGGEAAALDECAPESWDSVVCDQLAAAADALEPLRQVVGAPAAQPGLVALAEALVAHIHAGAAATEEATAQAERLEADVLRLTEAEREASARCTEAEAHASDVDAELRRVAGEAERVAALELENSELKTRCDLLRKEVQRQREAAERDRSTAVEATAGDAAALPTVGGAGAAPPLSRLPSAAVAERVGPVLGGGRGSLDGALKPQRTRAEQLMKENDDLKKENAHNNAVLAQYIRELEGYKANERVQVSIEYLRNIVQQFLCAAEELRPKMIPAICTVLEFNNKQKTEVQTANPRCPRFH
ncbi:GRIP domain containing protein [Novymonas esmeraldas]|uniref:GRIP domain containing protein n=1 Tax=Novymonas esmeraldas TaxID=1808958 RepID=A0AAW0F687_9TRYP